MICSRLRPGHLSICVGDGSWHSVEIVKNLDLSLWMQLLLLLFFIGTHKWAISAALLGGRVNRIAGNVLVCGPLLHRGIERRSLRHFSWDGYSVRSGLFWGERWWSVGVVADDGVHPSLGCILKSCCGRRLFFLVWIRQQQEQQGQGQQNTEKVEEIWRKAASCSGKTQHRIEVDWL